MQPVMSGHKPKRLEPLPQSKKKSIALCGTVLSVSVPYYTVTHQSWLAAVLLN